MSVRHLDSLFKPTSVAVVGASNNPESVGGTVMRNLLKSGFTGPIMPVNPKYEAVCGVLTYPEVSSLPVTPDMAVVCTSPATVPGLIHQLGERGTRGAVVITAGLSEHMRRDGQTVQEAMLAAAKPHLLRILGPNCVGLLIPGVGLNASFAHAPIEPGPLAFVSQSGAFCTATLDWARAKGIGFSHFISLGNCADVDFGDVLDYLGSAPETTAILSYMESLGADEARKFMSAARSAARNKPVLMIKAGRFAEGARAAASHTCALAGADNVYDAALRRAGILRVFDLDELFDAVETLARSRPLTGETVAILTNGGGPGVIAADALTMRGGKLAILSDETMRKLNDFLPGTWSRGNPVDMIGDAGPEVYVKALHILVEDPGVDAILVINAPSALAPPEDSARAIVDVVREAHLPILTSWLGGEFADRARLIFAHADIPTYDTPEKAVRALMHMVSYERNQDILTQVPPSAPTDFTPRVSEAKAVIEKTLKQGRELLTEAEAKEVLAAYGIPVVETRVASTPDEAAELAEEIGPPVALKILSPEISHKSDVGGVALGLGTAEEVRWVAEAMLARMSRTAPDAQLTGFTVQKMASRPQAHELIVGMSTDSIFGPIILFGRGGTAVEVIADRAVALPPLNMNLARHLISKTQVAKLLEGYRGRPPADFDAICLTLIQLSQLIVDCPEVAELDINPLFADNRGVLALDARVRVTATGAPGKQMAIRPYPRGLEETITLPSGREVFVRPIRPEDQPAHDEFLHSLSPEDLRFRLLGVTRDIPPSEMARLVQIDYDREMALIATAEQDGGKKETLAVVRAIFDPANTRADFAVMVRSGLRRTGLGTTLMNKIIAYCRTRGTPEIVGQVLADNEAMLNLTRRLGFDIKPLPDTGRCEVTLKLR
ncbi:MAG: bifunctional acetate--CoA ligase family protein/GNAT family N-acetyltransferase [Phycisphaerales bacterium]|nr:MAG: bifunctional acetate--CoA ligase family protein/GNAT family N-acetyltransferase [Phycisphaerales bacterium]